MLCFFFQAEDGIRDADVTGVQTCALPISKLQLDIALRRPAAFDRLSHLEALELRVIQIQRLVFPCPTVRCPERLRFGPSIEHSTVLPHRVGGIERMILRFRTLEKVKLYEAWHLLQMSIARNPDLLEGCFRAFGNTETVHGNKHCAALDLTTNKQTNAQ